MNYTIVAHPTKYAGVQFRSRLEARWAAFFDLKGWSWEYEPLDLKSWSPDFYVTAQDPVESFKGFAEVKPFVRSSQFDTQKMLNACGEESLLCGNGTSWVWSFEYNDDNGVFTSSDRGDGPCPCLHGPYHDPNYRCDQACWREAGNRVQWQPQKSA